MLFYIQCAPTGAANCAAHMVGCHCTKEAAFYLKVKLFSCIAAGTSMTEPVFGTGVIGTLNIL